ncbi:hypothetical protein Vau01_039090 [Virgisporangium aurantiacum]|uniref:Enoyl reductase (ER) domain-containing protein n=1 Tax=Virgisporangium aurantiacum TaxID=175570 RepID=A0A8J3Z7M3_9ACTN|nr:hypothetical protein Vau01_039090 [Virgisporangium aurantiacum]
MGAPAPTDFETRTAELPALEPGQVLVANRYMALGAVMRTMLAGGTASLPGFEPGEPLFARTLGTVLASAAPRVAAGADVVHMAGWSTHAVVDADRCRPVPDGDPMRHLSSGVTAYVGLRLAGVRAGDTVYVSSAAGAVGSAAGILARTLGAGRVVGGTRSAWKTSELVDRLGYDAAVDYASGDVEAALAACAPDGIDVYFDNVGGDHLATVVGLLNDGGRVALCGTLADRPGPRLDLPAVIGKGLTLRGFRASAHPDLHDGYPAPDLPHVVVDGLDAAPGALLDLFAGRYVGTVLVRLDGGTQ